MAGWCSRAAPPTCAQTKRCGASGWKSDPFPLPVNSGRPLQTWLFQTGIAPRRPGRSRFVNVNGSSPRSLEFSEIPERKIHSGRLVFENATSAECGPDVRFLITQTPARRIAAGDLRLARRLALRRLIHFARGRHRRSDRYIADGVENAILAALALRRSIRAGHGSARDRH